MTKCRAGFATARMPAHAYANCKIKNDSKARFPLQPYRSERYRISLFHEHSDRTNDMDTIEYATCRYDTAEMENGLNKSI